MKSRISE